MLYENLREWIINEYKEYNYTEEQITQITKGYEYEHLYTKKYGDESGIWGLMGNLTFTPGRGSSWSAGIYISHWIKNQKKYEEINNLYPMPLRKQIVNADWVDDIKYSDGTYHKEFVEFIKDDKITYYDGGSFNNLYIYAIENNMRIEDFFPIPEQRVFNVFDLL
jgi:hypothetical protein